jgi:putative flavoprotein involved in K+ transport
VGSGQSGCQIAEELNAAGREVVLSCGRSPWMSRRVGDRDIVWWVVTSGFFDQTIDKLPSPMARLISNIVSTGHDGGHDLHPRTLLRDGVTLTGHFMGASDGEVRFAPDLTETMAWSDARHDDIVKEVKKVVAEQGIEEPYIESVPSFDYVAPESFALADFGSVLFTSGFRPDYRSWLPWPDAFDDLGFPIHESGASITVPGLFFIGVHFLMKRKSSLLLGVGEDAAIVADRVNSYLS